MKNLRDDLKWIVYGLIIFAVFVLIPAFREQLHELDLRQSDQPVIENLLREYDLKLSEFKLDDARAHLVQIAENQYLVICKGEVGKIRCAQYKLINGSVGK